MLIIICGLPGTGKSSLSRKLREKIGAVYLNTDIIRKQITKKPDYSEEEKKRVYDEMINLAEKNINERKNVILDATFYSKKLRMVMKNISKDHYVILCSLPEKLVKERLMGRERRKKGISDADYGIYLELKKRFEPVEGEYLELDCSLPKSKQVEIVLGYIGVKHGH
ncbi:AAA family ATPase [Candidatus Micrarchaeota archaeon]|nr:AAA family ATPase [Candidatus Micrarchaeota archaeon]